MMGYTVLWLKIQYLATWIYIDLYHNFFVFILAFSKQLDLQPIIQCTNKRHWLFGPYHHRHVHNTGKREVMWWNRLCLNNISSKNLPCDWFYIHGEGWWSELTWISSPFVINVSPSPGWCSFFHVCWGCVSLVLVPFLTSFIIVGSVVTTCQTATLLQPNHT